MGRRDILVSVAAAAVCVGILALFTEVDLKLVRWVNCGPLASPAAREAEPCRASE